MYAKAGWLVGGCALALSLVAGCTLQKKDDADAFREAVPQSESISLSGPDSSSASNSNSNSTSTSTAPPPRAELGIAPPTPTYAKWYGFTRDMRDGVNAVTADVLGGVWLIIQSEPSALEKDAATWGPYTDELAPATYRFRATRIATDEYDYVLEGRPKASNSDTDYIPVLTGHGYGEPSALHGQGSFTISLDNAKALDPYKHPTDSGSVAVDYQLPQDFTEHLGALPRNISATVTPRGEAYYRVDSVANEDHTGTIQVQAHVDIDSSMMTLLEDVTVGSKWNQTGAGRADITIRGGDLPASIPEVDAVECGARISARATTTIVSVLRRPLASRAPASTVACVIRSRDDGGAGTRASQ
ncbi:MAG TPA: hypothetical protein VHV51_09185 [Polyangiaceae bacterium]|jgi:hypothetical protein|nr:hypothetical protein [Polyangiaceae bacterium]